MNRIKDQIAEIKQLKEILNPPLKKGNKNFFWKGGEKEWKNKKNLYSSNMWFQIRDKVINEEKCCQVCSTVDNLEVHHKIRYKLGGTNNRENLITLCKSHHQKIHSFHTFYERQYAPEILKEYLMKLKING